MSSTPRRAAPSMSVTGFEALPSYGASIRARAASEDTLPQRRCACRQRRVRAGGRTPPRP